MRKVIYVTSLSFDGYIEATAGDPSWDIPDEQLHRHFNELEQDIDTHLYGRRMYDLMVAYWPTADQNPSAPPYVLEYAHIWNAVLKVVFSKTLETVDWNSRLIRGDAAAEVAALKTQSGKNMSVGGLGLASALAAAGLIDEYRFYYVPILLGSGKAAFSELGQRVQLQPVETRTFASGTVLVRCIPATVQASRVQAA
jgi:dihydrofolate reductase